LSGYYVTADQERMPTFHELPQYLHEGQDHIKNSRRQPVDTSLRIWPMSLGPHTKD